MGCYTNLLEQNMSEPDWKEFYRKEVLQKQMLSKECEILMERLQEEKNRSCALRRGIKAVRELINESYGVDGLHKNGDISAWDELEQGGAFEEWLLDFNKAESYLVV